MAQGVFRRYTPVLYSSSSGSAWDYTAILDETYIAYPGGRRKRPIGAVNLFRRGTWLTVSVKHIEAGVSTDTWSTGFTQYRTDTLFGSAAQHLSGDIDFLKNRGANAVRSSAKGEGVNLPLMVAEMNQTNDTLRAICTELRSIASMRTRSGRRLRLVDTKIRLRDGGLTEGASNKILAYNYGIAPLLADLRTSMNLSKKRVDTHPLVRFIRETSKDEWSDDTVYPTGAKRRRKTRISVRTTGMFTFNSSPLLNAASQLRLTNPLELALERIPLSFLADWVVNLGDVVSSLDNPLTMGVTFEMRQDLKVEQDLMCFYKGGTHINKLMTKQRGMPGVASTISSLQFEPSLSARRLLNALALTRQRLPKSFFTST